MKIFGLVSGVAVALSLVGCGGGGGDSAAPAAATTAAPPEGVYAGTLTGGTNNHFELLALEDGSYWSIYGNLSGRTFNVSGFQGGTNAYLSTGTFSSNDSKDFGFNPSLSAAVTGSFNSGAHTVSGKSVVSGAAVSFSGGPISGSAYNYETPAVVGAINGAWTLQNTLGETLSVNISGGGAITGSSNTGCSFTGTGTPRPTGKNVFNVSILFGAGCTLTGQTSTGIALTYPITGTALNQLLITVVDSTRNYGLAAFGTR